AKNMAIIKKHNELYKQGKSSFMLGPTVMSDMTKEDMDSEFPAIKFNDTDYPLPPNLTESSVKSINWVDKNAVTKVRNLRKDGVCRAAAGASSVANVLEALVKMRRKKLLTLSMQELLDCGDTVCGGVGNFEKYSDYIMKNKGLVTEKNYPYVKKRQACTAAGKRFGRVNFVLTPRHTTSMIFKALLAKGPIATRILVTENFVNYKEGIFRDQCEYGYYSHTVLAVGFTEDYILLKNSWGTDWGEKGYMRISVHQSENCNIYLQLFAVI
ncbi:unnamed protein product, partial [Cercopithifilaria johnstoni]